MGQTNRNHSSTPATVALTERGIPFATHRYEHDPAVSRFGLEAAQKLGVEADRVFKTLLTEVDTMLVFAVVPVTGHLDVKALAVAVGGKRVALADPRVAERRTGSVVGGISPIGHRLPLVTIIDESAELWDTIFVSGGRRGLDIELSPGDLRLVTNGTIAAIGRL